MIASLVLSILAIVISLAGFVWNIFQYYDRVKSKVKVSYQYCYGIHPLMGELRYHSFTATNISQTKVTIRKFEFHLDSIPDKFLNFIDVLKMDYPFKLEPGEQQEVILDINIVNQALIDYKGSKLKMVAFDTLGKGHKSKWISISKF